MLKNVVDIGLSGIAFARFYLDTHPECRLMIFEKDGCIGGVWSAGRYVCTDATVTVART